LSKPPKKIDNFTSLSLNTFQVLSKEEFQPMKYFTSTNDLAAMNLEDAFAEMETGGATLIPQKQVLTVE